MDRGIRSLERDLSLEWSVETANQLTMLKYRAGLIDSKYITLLALFGLPGAVDIYKQSHKSGTLYPRKYIFQKIDPLILRKIGASILKITFDDFFSKLKLVDNINFYTNVKNNDVIQAEIEWCLHSLLQLKERVDTRPFKWLNSSDVWAIFFQPVMMIEGFEIIEDLVTHLISLGDGEKINYTLILDIFRSYVNWSSSKEAYRYEKFMHRSNYETKNRKRYYQNLFPQILPFVSTLVLLKSEELQ